MSEQARDSVTVRPTDVAGCPTSSHDSPHGRMCVHCRSAIGPRESYTDGFTTRRVWCHRPACIEAAANE